MSIFDRIRQTAVRAAVRTLAEIAAAEQEEQAQPAAQPRPAAPPAPARTKRAAPAGRSAKAAPAVPSKRTPAPTSAPAQPRRPAKVAAASLRGKAPVDPREAEHDAVAMALAGQTPLTKLDDGQLGELYEVVFGRPTTSTNRRYLIWFIREELKRRGEAPVDGRFRTPGEDGEPGPIEVKIIPLRLHAAPAVALDEAWRRLGFRSRTAFVRQAIADLLRERGEDEVAAMFLVDGADDDEADMAAAH